MNDVSFHVPYKFGNKQNSKNRDTLEKTEEQGTKTGRSRP